jgi:hypothetical protein
MQSQLKNTNSSYCILNVGYLTARGKCFVSIFNNMYGLYIICEDWDNQGKEAWSMELGWRDETHQYSHL